jgi:proteic killer suppression protein
MITSFAHKGLEDLFYTGQKGGITPQYARKLIEILDRLHDAHVVQDMGYPGAPLHPLRGDLAGYWSVRVSANRRVIFRFTGGHATDVNYGDYH